MTSWFTSSAEELRRQFEQLAGGKVDDKFISDDVGLGSLLQQGQKVLRATESAAEQVQHSVQQSVQRLASEADEGLQSVRGFAAAVGWSGQRAAADLQRSDLVSLYTSELESLGSFAEPDVRSEAAQVAAAAQTLSLWNQRLQGDFDSEGHRLAAPGLRGLIHTECLPVALRTLAAGRRRRPLLGRAAAVAAECASIRSQKELDGKGPEQKPDLSEAAVGEQLARLMLRASEAPEALIAQLLALLAEAAEAADRCGGALAEEKNPAEEDVAWVVNLILATLAEKGEADALASQRLEKALLSALENFAKASEVSESSSSTPQHVAASSKAAPFAGGGRPDIGGDVWACWPVDGQWYRAQVRGFAPRDRVRVTWCARPPGDENNEYAELGEDSELFNELSSSSVMRVDASIRRPLPAVLSQAPNEGFWNQSLHKVEAHSRNFQHLRHIGKQLDFHLDWDSTMCGEHEEQTWRYVPEDGCHIDIRSVPSVSGHRTNERLISGEVFKVSETFEGSDGTLFLKLADGRGWVFESKAGIGTLCVRCQTDSESEGHSDDVSCQERPPLSGAAETLSAWRVEIEERAEALGNVAGDCEEEVKTFKAQISTSTAAMSTELEALHAEQATTRVRADNLRMRREELLAQLLAVEEELCEVESADKALDHRESQLKNSMARVSTELAEQLESSQETGLVAACRQRVLQGTVAASKELEEQIAERAASAIAAHHSRKRLGSQQRKVGSAALESDRLRHQELQELLSSWQELIWGPSSGALVANAGAAALVTAHLQAVGLVEDAQKDAEEIAASSGVYGLEGFWKSGTSSKTALSRQMGRASAAYKLMREQLCENLARLGELQCSRPNCSSRSSSGSLSGGAPPKGVPDRGVDGI
ncbi:unnamed protein product [Effrenium voratum]|uniref:Uncharacterized protein n=1 Tax=Effrenium voratum TaxID=2562239 RepID=A0AA36N4B7_9DINO|nr:unnamed protein product [Effrenium voratum]